MVWVGDPFHVGGLILSLNLWGTRFGNKWENKQDFQMLFEELEVLVFSHSNIVLPC